MKHGNQKYDFDPLKNVGGEVTVKPANLYSLKSSLRQVGYKKEHLHFDELGQGNYLVKRIA
jgi:hypothetical protein